MTDLHPPRSSLWHHPLLWLAVGLVLRLAYLVEQQATSVLFYQPLLDELEMVRTARQLLAGGGFGHEPLFKAPLYPVLLAGVMGADGGGWPFMARLMQHLLGGVLILLAWDTARRAVSGPAGRGMRAGAVAAAAVAFYGPLIRLEDSLILDSLTVVLQSAMVWALVRMATTPRPRNAPRWAALAGLLAAASWLNRPTLTPVLPFLALWIAGRPLLPTRFFSHSAARRRAARGLAHAGLFLAFPLLAMGLVYWRNAAIGGEGMVLPWQGGYSFYYANGARANGKFYIQESYSLAQTGNPTRELAEAGYRNAVAAGTTAPAPAGHRYHAINRFWMNRALREIRQAPGRWLALMGKKLVYVTSEREIFNFEVYEVHKELSHILRWLPLSFGWLWPLALASLALTGMYPRGRRRLLGLLWLYGAPIGGAIALYYVSGRLRMPLVFPAAVLAGLTFEALTRPRPGGHLSRTRWLAALVLLLAGFALSWGDWWGVRGESLRHFELARLSNAAWYAGENPKALAWAVACEREHPGYPTASLLRGQALYGLNRLDEAAAAFRESMRRLPDDPVAPYNLGIIAYYDRPEPDRAAALFEEALRRQPTYGAAAWMGALARLRLGQRERAAELIQPYLPLAPSARAPRKLFIAAAALEAAQGNAAEANRLAGLLTQIHGARGHEDLVKDFEILKLKRPS